MKRLPLFAALLLSNGVAFGQEKYTFTPRVKAGDVFTVSTQRVEKLGFEPAGLMSGSMTRTLEQVTTILEAEGGRPTRFEERTVKHEDRMTGKVGGLPLDDSRSSLQGVTIRYERVGEKYESTLSEGKLNSEVAEKLRESPVFPLNENFLPTGALAVGESQTFTDQERLTWALKDIKSAVKYEEKPSITLEKVATVDGVKTAFLKLSFSGGSQVPPSAGKEPETFQARATVLYDLDRGYVSRVETRASLRAGGKINAINGIATADVVTVNRYRKNEPGPKSKP
jgi:hypothetical protein